MNYIKFSFTAIILAYCFQSHATKSQFSIGDRGYLMEACEEAISNTSKSQSFKSGYCFGIYNAATDANLLKMGTLGKDYCPTDSGLKTNVGMAIVAKWIRNHPKQWYTGQAYYSVVLAMKEAYPCN